MLSPMAQRGTAPPATLHGSGPRPNTRTQSARQDWAVGHLQYGQFAQHEVLIDALIDRSLAAHHGRQDTTFVF
jgi:hypothetical protein